MHTYDDALSWAVERLRVAGVASPQFDARMLIAHLLHCGHLDIDLKAEVMPGFQFAFPPLVQRRAAREPLQHILGRAWFGPLELKVGPGVFVPRPETEVLADWAVRQLRGIGKPRVVDLCTGSGALALYIEHHLGCPVWAVELSDAALAYARVNAKGTGVELVAGDATSEEVLAELNGEVDMVVCNPPYVPEQAEDERGEPVTLPPEVYKDPHMAVFGGGDGMAVIDKLVPTIARLLRPGGLVGIEHDDATSTQVQKALAEHGGFGDIAAVQDLTGRDRFGTARRL